MSETSALPRALESALRREGLRVKHERARGHVPLRVWGGTLGSTHVPPSPTQPWGPTPAVRPPVALFAPEPADALDHHDRLQIALALGRAVTGVAETPRLWITRSGSPELCPEDLTWLSAADIAWRTLGLEPDHAVVTREGWTLHPRGLTRHWRRLRE